MKIKTVKKEFFLLAFFALITNRLANEPGEAIPSDNLIECPYDIEKTKKYLEEVWDLEEQLRVLHRLKTDYLQSRHKFKPTDDLSYDGQVKLEISHKKLLVRYGRQPVFDKASGAYIQKLTVVGDAKILAIAFQKLLEHKGDNNRYYLSVKKDDYVLFLSNTLQTQEGKPISREILIKNILPLKNGYGKSLSKLLQSQFLDTISKEHHYLSDIEEVKKVVSGLITYKDRLIYLDRVLTNFLQQQKEGGQEHPFTRQMRLEIKHQQRERKLQKKKSDNSNNLVTKIKINGRVNVLNDDLLF